MTKRCDSLKMQIETEQLFRKDTCALLLYRLKDWHYYNTSYILNESYGLIRVS